MDVYKLKALCAVGTVSFVSTAFFLACGSDSADAVPESTIATGGTAGSNGEPATGGSETGGGSAAAPGSGGTILRDSGADAADGTGAPLVDPDASCADSEVQGDLKPANLLFVIDRSGSMNCNLPEDGQTTAECEAIPTKEFSSLPSKWELTQAALVDAFDALEQRGVQTSIGVTMFPVAPYQCFVRSDPDVPIAELDSQHNSDLDAFLETVEPGGKTPLAGATILGYQHLLKQLQAGNLPGSTFLVLITDGFETCKPEELARMLAEDVPNAYNVLRVRTFVIGAPGSEDARSLLSQMAWAGATSSAPDCTHDPAPPNVGDCHFDMSESTDFASDLAAALEQISGRVLTCEVDVPTSSSSEGVDLEKVNVDIDEVPYYQTDCSVEGNSGWQYNDDSTRIILCGEACDAARVENATVSILLGCPTRGPE